MGSRVGRVAKPMGQLTPIILSMHISKVMLWVICMSELQANRSIEERDCTVREVLNFNVKSNTESA